MPEAIAPTDTRYLYGVSCAWFGPMQEVAEPAGLTCCPGCGATLYETSREDWWNTIRRLDLSRPGYLAFMEWLDAELRTGRHFSTHLAAASAYQRETGLRTPGWEQVSG